MFICTYCGKSYTYNQARTKHEKQCKMNPDGQNVEQIYDEQFCKFCGKSCHNINSLRQHEIRCKENPDRKDVYKDGFNKNTKGINKCSHTGKVCITNGFKNDYIDSEDVIPEGWHLGSFTRGYPGHFRNKSHIEEAKAKISRGVSATRRKRIQEGTITPVTCHRYTNSYIKYQDGSKRFLRSSYELIVAIFLDICNIPFTYESVRAPYKDKNGNEHSFLGDFCIGNIVLEIKGAYDSEKLIQEATAFHEMGYELRVILEKEVFIIKDLLAQLFDIELLLEEAKSKSKAKQYFTYKLSF